MPIDKGKKVYEDGDHPVTVLNPIEINGEIYNPVEAWEQSIETIPVVEEEAPKTTAAKKKK